MRKSYLLILLCFSFFGAKAQLSGTKTIPGDYSSISAAIAAVNTQGVGAGGVVFNIAAGYTENLNATLNLTATGTIANPITFQKSGSGANPLITAYPNAAGTATTASAVMDGIFAISGGDYITINGIDLQENAANTTAAACMEYGYGLFKNSATDGCNNNTIKNCTITLNRVNNATAGAVTFAGNSGIVVLNSTFAAQNTALTVTSVDGASSNNKFYTNTIQNVNCGITLSGFAGATPFTLCDTGNDIGGTSSATGNNIINFGGGASATNPCAAVYVKDQWSFNISYNTVDNNVGGTGNAGGNHAATNRGIFAFASSVGASATMNNNNVTIRGGSSTTAIDWAIDCEMAQTGSNGNTISINNNTLSITKTTATAVALTAIWVASAPTTMNINGNTVTNFVSTTTATADVAVIRSGTSGIGTLNIQNNSISGVTFNGATGTHYIIGITGTVVTALNITNNSINGVTLASTTTKTFYNIYTSTAVATCTNTISNNTFQNISYTGGTATTGAFGFIYALGSPLSWTINNNSLIGSLTLPTTTGALYFIYNSQSTSLCTVNGNNLTGSGITRTGTTSGLTYGYYNGSSPTGTFTFSNNTFSNITIPSTSTGAFYGIYLLTSTSCTQKIQSNTFSNITSGTGTFYGINHLYGNTGSEVSGNTITNLNGAGTIAGINIGSTASITMNVFNNNVNGITTTGASAATGILHSAGTSTNIYQNKIFNITSNNAVGTAAGLTISGGTTVTAYNNIIGDIKTPISNAANPLNGFNVTGGTTVNLYYNTVNLSGSSTGALFGSSALYASSTPTLNLRNNIFSNNSIPSGAGKIVAYQRSSTTLTTFASTSNNNLYYAGTPGPSNMIYFDGTNTDIQLTDYKSRVTPRDASSVTENPTFVSTTGANATYLHINTTTPTYAESNGSPISGITTDFDGDTRSTANPDMGADEFNGVGIDAAAPNISYTLLTTTCATGDRTLSGVAISDYTGVPTTGVNVPRIYYNKNNSAWSSKPGTLASGTATNGTWSFTIAAADMGGLTAGDSVKYYIIAQDILPTPNISSFPVGVNAFDVNTVNSHPIAPNGYAIGGSLSGNYTVGGGGAYPTLTAAVAAYNAACLLGPVTFSLTDPNYPLETYPIVINANPYASSTNTLTIKPATGMSPSFSGAAASLLKLNGADYIIIDGSNSGTNSKDLTFNNTQTTASNVIWLASMGGAGNGATNNTIKNTIITAGVAGTSGVYGIISGTTAAATTAGEDNDKNTIQNNTITNAYIGISMLNSTSPTVAMDSLVIKDNTIGDAASNLIGLGAIQVSYVNAPLISNNTIVNVKTTGSLNTYGIDLGAGVNGGTVSRNNISGIYSTSTGGWGAYGINFSSGTGTTNVTVVNNFISDIQTANYSTSSTTYNAFGIRITGGINHKLYHNSVNLYGSITPGTSAGMSACMTVTASTVTGLDIRNNIFSNTQTFGVAGSSVYNIYLGVAGITFTTSNYNDYYGTDGTNTTFRVGYDGAGARTSLSNWATFTTQDVNSVSANPEFTTNTDLHVSNGPTISVLESSAPLITGVTTDYDNQVRPGPTGSVNGGPFGGKVDIGADEFDRAPQTCNLPTAVVISSVTGSSATVSWTAASPAPASGYEYVVSTSNTSPSAAGTTVTGVTVNITGLTPNTLYYFFVRSNCGSGNYSVWSSASSFTTPCLNYTLPLTEGFNTSTTTEFPACWSQQFAVGSSSLTFQTSSTNPTTTPQEGSRFVYWNSYSITSGNETRLVSPPITTTGTASVDVNFQWFFDNSAYTTATYADEGVFVDYSLNGTTWTTVGTQITRLSATSNGWTLTTVTLPAAAGNQPTVYVAFRFRSRVGNNCALDAVSIQATPNCVIPSTVTSSNIGTTTATISWTAPATGGTPTGYEYVVSTSNTAPSGSGTSTVTTTANLTGLTANTTYYIFVRTNCGSGSFSAWTSSVSFTTLCNTSPVPLSQDFESAAAMPGCWSTQFVSGSKAFSIGSTTTAIGTSPNPAAYGGTNRLLFPSYSGSGNQTRLVSAPLTSTGLSNVSLEYYWYHSIVGGATLYLTEGVQVQWSTDGTTWTNVGAFIPRYNAVEAWTLKSLNLPVGATNQAKLFIGFLFTSNAGYDCFIDNISIKQVALPATITKFAGTKQANQNLLTWTTASEQNNKGFELQRSADGINYSILTFVNSKAINGNSNTTLDYTFTDNKPFAGNSYYRLKQLDKDGKESISQVVLLKGAKGTQLDITSIYPNPTTSQLNVVMSAPSTDKVTIVITDVAGKILVQKLVNVIAGDNGIQLDVSKLASGTYVMKAICENGCDSGSKKFMKQ